MKLTVAYKYFADYLKISLKI